ncbi:MAG: transcriptional repressor LexA [Elusimicrobiota bacterium]
MIKEISKRQKQILDFLISEIDKNGIPPSLREIRDHFGFSSLSSPRYHLRKLARKGYINLKGSISRGIEIPDFEKGIPVLGNISAGLPLEAVENIEGHLDLSRIFKEKKNLFCLKIKGDSMEGAGIMDGDIIIVRKQPRANNGDIVVAIFQDEALVKRLVKKRKKMFLTAENPNYPDIELKRARILGKVTGVLRDYEQVSVH